MTNLHWSAAKRTVLRGNTPVVCGSAPSVALASGWKIFWHRAVPRLPLALILLASMTVYGELSQYQEEMLGYVQTAEQYYNSGNYAGAAEYYQKGYTMTSRTRGLMFRYASSLAKSGRGDEAEQFFNKVLQDNPIESLWDKGGGDRSAMIAESNIQLGAIYEKRKWWDAAFSSYDIASSMTASGWRGPYLTAALLLEHYNNPTQAIDYLNSALNREPGSEPVLNLLASCYNKLGIESGKAGDLDGATYYFSKALEYRPGWKVAQDNMDEISTRRALDAIDTFSAQGAADAQRPAAGQPVEPERPPVPDLPQELVEKFIETVRFAFGPDDVAAMLKEEPRLALVRDISETTTLHWARTKEVAEVLLKAGADPKIKSIIGQSAIFGAVTQESPEVAAFLVENGADTTERDNEGRTLLHEAVSGSQGSTSTLEWVISNTAQIDTPDKRGITPLMLAAENMWPDFVDLLLAHGTDLSLKDADGKTAADHAAGRGHSEFESKLRNLAAISPRPRNYLVEAASSGDIEALRSVFALAPGLVESSRHKEALVHFGARAGKRELLEFLIKNGARLDQRDVYDETPLDIAARAGDEATVRLLTAAGANVSSRNSGGYSALDNVLLANIGPECVTALIDAGADVNAECGAGSVPLGLAAGNGNAEMIRLLLKRGAKARTENQAVSPLFSANAECAAILLDAGADVNVQDSYSATPLLCATGRYEPETVKLFVERGADVNAVNSDGQCALHLGNLECCKVLIAHGANVNLQDKSGRTPLDFALEMSVDKEHNTEESMAAAKATAEFFAQHGAKHASEL